MMLFYACGEKTEPGDQMSTTLYAQRKEKRVLVCVCACMCACMCVYVCERDNPGKEEFFLSFNNKM